MSKSASEQASLIQEDVTQTIGELEEQILSDEWIDKTDARAYHYLVCMQATLIVEQTSEKSFEDLASDLEHYAEKVRELGSGE